jgi:hypothetical protein
MSRFRRRTSFPRDPHWIGARYAGNCADPACGNRIQIGDRVFHYPNGGSTYCTTCSEPVSRRTAAELADEDLFCAR